MRATTNQVLLLIMLHFLGGCGSAATGPDLQESGFSKLEGRWSVTFREMQRALTGEMPSSDDLDEAANRRIVLLTIRADGSIDWSRSESGVSFGLHGLRKKGDQGVGLRYESGRFKVMAANYAPTRSHVEIRGLSRDEGLMQSLASAVIDVELQPDASAQANMALNTFDSFSVSGDGRATPTSGPERTQLNMRLQRHDSQPLRSECTSRSAGYWSGSSDGKIALIIQRDGTFDWSGTIEGMLGGWHQLERKGDLSFNRMGGQVYEVVEHLYTETESILKIQMAFIGEDGKPRHVTQRLSARALDDQSIAVDVDTEEIGLEKSHSRATLHRVKGAGERSESVLSEIVRLSEPNGPKTRL